MLGVKLICVGKMKERFYTDAFAEYAKRLGGLCRFELAEVAEERLSDSPSQSEVSAALAREAENIRKQIPKGARLVAMCIEGREMSSDELAGYIGLAAGSGVSKLCFAVGGSFGLHESIKNDAELRLSMSRMTFPHHLARVMLAEQIYRALSIGAGSRYHK